MTSNDLLELNDTIGGLYVSGQSNSMKLDRLTFQDNVASISGGALLVHSSSLTHQLIHR